MPFATAVTRGERRGWIRRRTARSIPLVEPRLTATAVPPATAAAESPMPTRGAIMYTRRASDVPQRRPPPLHRSEVLAISLSARRLATLLHSAAPSPACDHSAETILPALFYSALSPTIRASPGAQPRTPRSREFRSPPCYQRCQRRRILRLPSRGSTMNQSLRPRGDRKSVV